MNEEVTCAVVKDLLPNYIEKLTSEETNQLLEKHLETCAECAREREKMMAALTINKVPENTDLKKFLNKTKKMYLVKGFLLSLGIISILVSFIVDIAVNRRLTWSLIVDYSIFFIYAVSFTAIISKKDKTIKAIAVFSIFLLPMFFVIEYVINKNYVLSPVYWVKQYAFPIALIWLAIIWIMVVLKKFMRWSVWNILALTFFLSIFASAYTNVIAEQISIIQLYQTHLEWINSFLYFGCGILCFIIGYMRRNKKKN